MAQQQFFQGEKEYKVILDETEKNLINGELFEVKIQPGLFGSMTVRFGSVTYNALVHQGDSFTEVCIDGHRFRFEHFRSNKHTSSHHRHGEHQHKTSGSLTSPMTGRVRRFLVEKGAVIEAGMTLAIVEAMKMEFPIKASFPGQISKIYLKEGDPVEMGSVLIDIEQNFQEN